MLRFRSASGFSLVELMVVIGIVAVLAALLFPTFAQARAKARQTTCVSNIRQINAALLMYAQDNDGYFCPADDEVSNWAPAISVYAAASRKVFRCPSCNVPSVSEQVIPGFPDYLTRGYALNFELTNYRSKSGPPITVASVIHPSSTVALCEMGYRTVPGTHDGASFSLTRSAPDDGSDLEPKQKVIGRPGGLRHHDGSNYAFVDGHVKWHAPKEVWSAVRGNNGQHPSFGLNPLPAGDSGAD